MIKVHVLGLISNAIDNALFVDDYRDQDIVNQPVQRQQETDDQRLVSCEAYSLADFRTHYFFQISDSTDSTDDDPDVICDSETDIIYDFLPQRSRVKNMKEDDFIVYDILPSYCAFKWLTGRRVVYI